MPGCGDLFGVLRSGWGSIATSRPRSKVRRATFFSEEAQLPHLSRRGYARSRNLSEASIRRHLASGVLADALTPDGLLDADKADELLRGSITRKAPTKVPAVLKTARQRHLRAKVRRLQDEVAELRGTLAEPALVAPWVALANGQLVASLRRLVDAAPAIAGRPADEVHRALGTAVNDAYQHFQDVFPGWWAEHGPKAPPPEPEPDLDAMGIVELTALQSHLAAEILERERHLAKGVVRHIDDFRAESEERLVVSKSLFTAIPGRVAQQVAVATVEEARELLSCEVELAVAALEVPTDA